MKYLVIGIDAALAVTGWGAVYGSSTEDAQVVGYGVIETEAAQPLQERLTLLRERLCKVLRAQFVHATPERIRTSQCMVAIEHTDYSPGRAGTRERWIREARAREALAFGVSAAVLASDDCHVVAQLVGPNEWHAEFGVSHASGEVKAQVAELVAYQFPQTFESEFVKSRKRSKYATPYERAVMERNTRVRVPSHVTDALGLAYVVLQRRCQAARLAQNEDALASLSAMRTVAQQAGLAV